MSTTSYDSDSDTLFDRESVSVVATSREQVNRHLAVAREKAESAERALAILSQILSSAASSDLPAPSSFSTSRAGSPTSNTHIDTMPDTASDVGTAPLNGQHSPSNGNRVSTERDDDEQQELIRSLRAQMGDLATQVSQLNSKLVTSYNRISDLEDELHDTTSSLTTFRNRASDLEGKLVQHEALLQTGTLVSRNEIASELQRLMEAAAEAALDKGRAEEARESIERDLSDLSESLFGEAGRMVRDARKEMAEQERRMGEMEKEVKESERMVSMLLGQLRTFRENGTAGAELSPSSFAATRRMSERHLRRFNDKNASFLAFEALLKHIAFLKLSAPSMAHPPPALPALLNTTFISKLVVEDSDPTLRLDTAPSLNWLTRRAVLSAVYSGQLSILSSPSSHPHAPVHIQQCSLCGCGISHTSQITYKFLLPTTINTAYSSTPITLPASLTTFPLCTVGPRGGSGNDCLRRLRTTCSMWAYMRGVIEHIYATSPIHRNTSYSIEGVGGATPSTSTSTPSSSRPSTPLSGYPSAGLPTEPGRRAASATAVARKSLTSFWGAIRSASASSAGSAKSTPASSPLEPPTPPPKMGPPQPPPRSSSIGRFDSIGGESELRPHAANHSSSMSVTSSLSAYSTQTAQTGTLPPIPASSSQDIPPTALQTSNAEKRNSLSDRLKGAVHTSSGSRPSSRPSSRPGTPDILSAVPEQREKSAEQKDAEKEREEDGQEVEIMTGQEGVEELVFSARSDGRPSMESLQGMGAGHGRKGSGLGRPGTPDQEGKVKLGAPSSPTPRLPPRRSESRPSSMLVAATTAASGSRPGTADGKDTTGPGSAIPRPPRRDRVDSRPDSMVIAPTAMATGTERGVERGEGWMPGTADGPLTMGAGTGGLTGAIPRPPRRNRVDSRPDSMVIAPTAMATGTERGVERGEGSRPGTADGPKEADTAASAGGAAPPPRPSRPARRAPPPVPGAGDPRPSSVVEVTKEEDAAKDATATTAATGSSGEDPQRGEYEAKATLDAEKAAGADAYEHEDTTQSATSPASATTMTQPVLPSRRSRKPAPSATGLNDAPSLPHPAEQRHRRGSQSSQSYSSESETEGGKSSKHVKVEQMDELEELVERPKEEETEEKEEQGQTIMLPPPQHPSLSPHARSNSNPTTPHTAKGWTKEKDGTPSSAVRTFPSTSPPFVESPPPLPKSAFPAPPSHPSHPYSSKDVPATAPLPMSKSRSNGFDERIHGHGLEAEGDVEEDFTHNAYRTLMELREEMFWARCGVLVDEDVSAAVDSAAA